MKTTTQTLEHVPTSHLRSLAIAGLIGLAVTGWTTEPAASTAKANVEGGLDKTSVREVVRANIDDVRVCYNAELIEDEDLGGRIVVEFAVSPEGSVADVSISESSMPARFDACLAAAVETWRFPSADAATQVSYPFELSPG